MERIKRAVVPDKGSCFSAPAKIEFAKEWEKTVKRIRGSQADLGKIMLVSKEGKYNV